MTLTPGQEFDFAWAVHPSGDDLDGKVLAGLFEGAPAADWEAAVAEEVFLQGNVVAVEERRFLK